jgi:hypothetical protein
MMTNTQTKEARMTSREVKRIIEATMNFDTVAVRGEVVICKQSYFYHHGASTEKLAARIQHKLPQVEILETHDYFKSWPATSYMEVRCKFVPNKPR